MISAVIASLTVRRVSASAWRATVAALHLIGSAVATSTTGNASAIRHLAVALRPHGRATLTVSVIAATSRAWATHWRLLTRIAGHGSSRGRPTLRCHGLRTAILRKAICWRSLSVAWCLWLLRRVSIKLASRWTILAPLRQTWLANICQKACFTAHAALKRSTIDVVAAKLTDRHGCILVGIHLNKSKATIRLEASLSDKAKILEERNKIVLSGVGSKITDVASGLPLGSLRNDHLIALHAVCREVVVAEGSGRSHSHR